MYRIIRKKTLNRFVTEMDIEAPLVARKAKPGQFVILRIHEDGERIPLTIAGTDEKNGAVRLIFQIVGATTEHLNHLREGDCIRDLVGPLGAPSHLDGIEKACIIGGGVGCAIAMPIAKELKRRGAEVTSIIGFRSKELVILEDEFSACSSRLFVTTDDGSYGRSGLVTEPLLEMLKAGERFDVIFAIGPLTMMKAVTEAARPFGVPVTVSMNPIMIDGTGMCGGCRLTVVRDGVRSTRFACVEGPDFNGYEIDFDEAISRGRMYTAFERKAHEHACRLLGKEDE